MGNIQTVGPNEALIVSGGCCRPSKKQIIIGGWCWNTFLMTNVQRLSLQIMTLNPRCENVQSSLGVPVTITGVAHCKIVSNMDTLPIAAEQFLGKTTEQIKSIVLQTIEGHIRAIIGTQKLGDICVNRKILATLIRESATEDLARMGIDILSLTIKEIRDDVEFLSSSGKKKTAELKKDAALAAAEAESQAARKELENENEKKAFLVSMDDKLAALKHEEEQKIVNIRNSVAEAKANAEKAYDLELAKQHTEIRTKEMEVELMVYEKRIEIQKLEAKRRETELEMEIELPTASEIYEMTKENEASQIRLEHEANAEMYRIYVEGRAKAATIKMEGEAEAHGLKEIAQARSEFKEAANLYEVIKILPEIAAELASPLTKFDEIVLISDKNSNSNQNQAQVKATGVAKTTSAITSALRSIGSNENNNMDLIKSIMQLPEQAMKRSS